MITQEKFDVAYRKIVELRDQARMKRKELCSEAHFDPKYHRADGEELGLCLALQFLEEADMENE